MLLIAAEGTGAAGSFSPAVTSPCAYLTPGETSELDFVDGEVDEDDEPQAASAVPSARAPASAARLVPKRGERAGRRARRLFMM
jgi:hypothetical protein